MDMLQFRRGDNMGPQADTILLDGPAQTIKCGVRLPSEFEDDVEIFSLTFKFCYRRMPTLINEGDHIAHCRFWSGSEPLVTDFQELVLSPGGYLLGLFGRTEKATPYFSEVIRIVPFLGLAPGGKDISRVAHDVDQLGIWPQTEEALGVDNIAGRLFSPPPLSLLPSVVIV